VDQTSEAVGYAREALVLSRRRKGYDVPVKLTEDLPEPLQPPSKEDVLFAFDSIDPMANARVNYSGRPDLFYTIGYREGATLLVNHVLETYCDQDTLVFPIADLYRHHVELLLKRLILLSAVVLRRELSGDETKHLKKHRLDLLWSDVKQALPVSYKRANLVVPAKAEVEGVDSYIRQLTERDATSETFRYPTSNGGEATLDGLTHINIRSLALKMERLCDWLTGIEDTLQQFLDFEAEMRASIF